jgi:hypothetical protein
MEAFKISDAKSTPCGTYGDFVRPTTETITMQFQCWKQTPHNPSSCQAIYASNNLALTGGGGCGVWLGGVIPGQGGSCNPYFAWGTSDITGTNGSVNAHLAQFEVQSYVLIALPPYPIIAPICFTGGYQVKTWQCSAVYCT